MMALWLHSTLLQPVMAPTVDGGQPWLVIKFREAMYIRRLQDDGDGNGNGISHGCDYQYGLN